MLRSPTGMVINSSRGIVIIIVPPKAFITPCIIVGGKTLLPSTLNWDSMTLYVIHTGMNASMPMISL